MAIIEYVWDWVLPFLIVLTVLVFVHELGHYWIARRVGVRVEVFSIGFGPEIFGRTDSHGTRWKVSAVPLGGYVKMFGEHDFGDEEETRPRTAEEEAVSFQNKSVRQRSAVVVAGPLANFLFAVVVLAVLFASAGVPTPKAGVGSVQPGSAADLGGFKSGDVIVAIDDRPVRWFEDVRGIVRDRPGESLRFDVVRDGEPMVLTATPIAQPAEPGESGRKEVGLLGITPDPAQVGYERLNPLRAAGVAVERTYDLTAQILTALWQIITGSRTAEELGGPIRIAQLSGQMASDGAINFVLFMAALSINLGLINLLPIPMLDGGHLAFYAVEAVRGRPLSKTIQEYGLRIGLAFVLFLMIFATWNDLMNLKVFEFLRELIS
jgi:regulator of sigma E protease